MPNTVRKRSPVPLKIRMLMYPGFTLLAEMRGEDVEKDKHGTGVIA